MESSARAEEPRSVGWRGWAQRLAPFVITAVVVAAILTKYSIAEIAVQIGEGDALGALPFAILLMVVYVFWAAFLDTRVLRHVGAPRFVDVVRGKAAMAMLTALGYVFGNGGYGVWLARATGTGGRVAAGLVVYFILSDLAAVGILASGVMPFAGDAAPAGLQIAAGAIAVVPLAVLMAGPHLPARVFFDAWRLVPRRVGLLQIGGRCMNIGFSVAMTSLAIRSFGLTIPVVALATYVPLLLLISALPINVLGLGAAQGAWLLFFLPWESGPRILAFQFLWSAMLAVVLVLRGLPFLRGALAQMSGAKDRPPRAVV